MREVKKKNSFFCFFCFLLFIFITKTTEKNYFAITFLFFAKDFLSSSRLLLIFFFFIKDYFDYFDYRVR